MRFKTTLQVSVDETQLLGRKTCLAAFFFLAPLSSSQQFRHRAIVVGFHFFMRNILNLV